MLVSIHAHIHASMVVHTASIHASMLVFSSNWMCHIHVAGIKPEAENALQASHFEDRMRVTCEEDVCKPWMHPWMLPWWIRVWMWVDASMDASMDACTMDAPMDLCKPSIHASLQAHIHPCIHPSTCLLPARPLPQSQVMHGAAPTEHIRTNSPLNKEQQRACEDMAAAGQLPKQMKEELQKRSLRAAGCKDPGGGMPGVPKPLAPYQRLKARVKKDRDGAQGGIDVVQDLKRWVEANRLPDRKSALCDNMLYSIPVPTSDEPEELAVACIGKTQVMWCLQLLHRVNWAMHCDGKHRIHKDHWCIITCGTHTVEHRANADCKSNAKGIVHTFKPIVYTFAPSESVVAVKHGFKAMEVVARMCAAA